MERAATQPNVCDARVKIELRNLGLYYENFKALEDINLHIMCNSITAIIGPSGCGKSTALRSLNRMNELIEGARVEGKVIMDGENIYERDYRVVRLRKRVGMVFQRPNPFPTSIYDNIAFGPRLFGVRERNILDCIIEESLRRAALWDEVKDKLRDSALTLSGGQQQRLCIARVLSVQPEVILLDEPCAALDPIATQRIEDLLSELKNEYTIVTVTHNMQQAARISDFTAFFMIENQGEPGRIVEFGETSKIFTNPDDERTEQYITGRFG
ncbi:MAG: phosphate ABC transporter ATP-binding protein [Actinobacteria bacterium RBG_19FT_COMBO_54_7]|nr:MAG: phosphate ABC transporter ATP-binding protein [Actinobacteria bacterium RBG_19FT_COMBO_54_7]